MVYIFYRYSGHRTFVYSTKMQPNANFKELMIKNSFVKYRKLNTSNEINNIFDEMADKEKTYAYCLDDDKNKIVSRSFLSDNL